MTLFVTLQQAKTHLHVDDSEHDADIEGKVEQASGILWDHLKLTAIPATWVNDASPPVQQIPYLIQAITLRVVGELYWNRESSTGDLLSQADRERLKYYRDPAMA